jgi:hypothetical protein
MVLGIVLVLFLIAAILFAIDFFLGFAVEAQYGPYRYRVYSLCFALMCIAFILWHGGRG